MSCDSQKLILGIVHFHEKIPLFLFNHEVISQSCGNRGNKNEYRQTNAGIPVYSPPINIGMVSVNFCQIPGGGREDSCQNTSLTPCKRRNGDNRNQINDREAELVSRDRVNHPNNYNEKDARRGQNTRLGMVALFHRTDSN